MDPHSKSVHKFAMKHEAKKVALEKAKRVRGHKDKEHAYAAVLKANK